MLDFEDNPIGYKDATEVDKDYGVALEIWTGGKGYDTAHPDQLLVFSTVTTGLQYGYFLFGGVKWLWVTSALAPEWRRSP